MRTSHTYTVHEAAARLNASNDIGLPIGRQWPPGCEADVRMREAAIAVHLFLEQGTMTMEEFADHTPRSNPDTVARMRLLGLLMCLPGSYHHPEQSASHYVYTLIQTGTKGPGRGIRRMRPAILNAGNQKDAVAALEELLERTEPGAPGDAKGTLTTKANRFFRARAALRRATAEFETARTELAAAMDAAKVTVAGDPHARVKRAELDPIKE